MEPFLDTLCHQRPLLFSAQSSPRQRSYAVKTVVFCYLFAPALLIEQPREKSRLELSTTHLLTNSEGPALTSTYVWKRDFRQSSVPVAFSQCHFPISPVPISASKRSGLSGSEIPKRASLFRQLDLAI